MGSPLTSSSQSKEILCIEEHGDICILLRKMLDGNEYKVAHARDTRQAGDYLRTTQPVMVLIENSFFADRVLNTLQA
jgi:DNA-binding NtrC family response regulator